MKKSKPSNWKKLRQDSKRKPHSKIAKNRRRKRSWGIILLFLFFVLVIYAVWEIHKSPLGSLFSQKIEFLEVSTNGCLPQKTLFSQVEELKGTGILSADLSEIKRRFASFSQIDTIEVSRFFPSTIKIAITEHIPLLKIAIRKGLRRQLFFVSEKGMLFSAQGLTKQQINAIPYLSGIRLKRENLTVKPLKGMQLIGSLMHLAKEDYPHLYHDWKGISCKGFDPLQDAIWSRLEIDTRTAGRVIFGNDQFDDQLQRLDYVVQNMNKNGIAPIDRIDLSLKESAFVQLDKKFMGQRKKPLPH